MLSNESGMGGDRCDSVRGDLDGKYVSRVAAIEGEMAAAEAKHELFLRSMPEDAGSSAMDFLSYDSLYASHGKDAYRAAGRAKRYCGCLECQRSCRDHKVASTPDPEKYAAEVAEAEVHRSARENFDKVMQEMFERLSADDQRIVETVRDYYKLQGELRRQLDAVRREYRQACGCDACEVAVWNDEQFGEGL